MIENITKRIPPIATVMIIWCVSSIALYKVTILGISLIHYTLYGLLSLGFLTGYLRREDLSITLKSAAALVFSFWLVLAWSVLSVLLPPDLFDLIASPGRVLILLGNTSMVFFLSVLSLCPLIRFIYGEHAVKMGYVIAAPALTLTSNMTDESTLLIFLSIALTEANMVGVMLAMFTSFIIVNGTGKRYLNVFSIIEILMTRHDSHVVINPAVF